MHSLNDVAENRLLSRWATLLPRAAGQIGQIHQSDAEIVPLGDGRALALTVDTIAEEFKLEKAEDKDAEMLRQKQERVEWLASAVEIIGKAVTTHELKLLNVKYIREATRRNEPTFIARITRAFEERKASLEKGTEAAA